MSGGPTDGPRPTGAGAAGREASAGAGERAADAKAGERAAEAEAGERAAEAEAGERAAEAEAGERAADADAGEPVDREALRRARRRRRAAQDAAEDAVPQLPRAKFFRRLAMLDLFRIAMLGALLVAVIALRKPCADAASSFVSSFDPPPPDAAPAAQGRAQGLEGYELVPAEELLERLRDAGTAGDL